MPTDVATPAASHPLAGRLLSPVGHIAAVRELLRLARTHKPLIVELALRDVRDRFAGHVLGSLWALANPLLLMLLYAAVFTFVFPARGIVVQGRTFDLTAYILAGLIPWLCVQEVLARSTWAISANASLVKQIVFPIEVLPIKTVFAALPAQMLATAFLLVWLAATERLSGMLVMYPVALGLQVAFMTGVALALSCIGAYVKDMREVIGFFCTVNLFLQPILYVPGQLPPALRPLLWLNPFSHLVWVFQDTLYFGAFTHPWSWVTLTVLSALSLSGGYRLFRTMKHRFGDVL